MTSADRTSRRSSSSVTRDWRTDRDRGEVDPRLAPPVNQVPGPQAGDHGVEGGVVHRGETQRDVVDLLGVGPAEADEGHDPEAPGPAGPDDQLDRARHGGVRLDGKLLGPEIAPHAFDGRCGGRCVRQTHLDTAAEGLVDPPQRLYHHRHGRALKRQHLLGTRHLSARHQRDPVAPEEVPSLPVGEIP